MRVAGLAGPRSEKLLTAGLACTSVLRAQSAVLFSLINTGDLFVSSDQGATWQIRSTLAVRDAVGLVAGDSNQRLFLVTRSGSVYRSTNAGTDWLQVGAVAASDVEAVTTRQDGALLLLTATGTIWMSNDQGVTFIPLAALSGSNLLSLARAASGWLYALTATGEVEESTDNGANWITKGVIDISDAVEILGFGPNLVVLTGTGDIARSTNAGATWQTVGTLSQVHMSGLTTTPAGNSLVAATREGEVATSPDGIAWTWVGTINQLAVAALANDTPTGVGVGDDEAPRVRFRVGLPWPNPAITGIDPVAFPFTLQGDDTVGLEIYDAVGRLLAGRAPERFAAGEHAIGFGINGLGSGVYFARLSTGSGLTVARRWALVH